MTNPRGIPTSVKRQVRQECRFGCVICGMPIFHYDHIIEFSVVKRHDVENLALLCPNHHQDKTSGRLDADTVAAYRRKPFNSTRTFTSGHRLALARRFSAILGTNSGWKDFGPDGGDYSVLWANGTSLLVIHAEGGWLSLSIRLTDSNGTGLLIVDRGELTISTAEWDYEYQGVALKVLRSKRDVLLDIDLANDHVIVRKGAFIVHGVGFIVAGDQLSTVVNGRKGMTLIGSSSYNNGFGGWGISTTGMKPPGGFGFFVG